MTAALDLRDDPFTAIVGSGRGARSDQRYWPATITSDQQLLACLTKLWGTPGQTQDDRMAIRDAVVARYQTDTARAQNIAALAQAVEIPHLPKRSLNEASSQLIKRLVESKYEPGLSEVERIERLMTSRLATDLAYRYRDADLQSVLANLLDDVDQFAGDIAAVPYLGRDRWVPILSAAIGDRDRQPGQRLKRVLERLAA